MYGRFSMIIEIRSARGFHSVERNKLLIMEEIADIIECSICLETFTDPRMLPCIHTFCLKCLEQIVLKTKEQHSKGTLHCPICRVEFAIPPQGVEGFQKNFFIERLKEIIDITKSLDKSCDICLESKECDEDEISPADIYCVQCHKNICKRCSKCHKSIAALKEHHIIQLGTQVDTCMLEIISHRGCSQHKNELANMYCNDCKAVICVVCFAENHQNHKCSGVEKVAGTFRQDIAEVLSAIESCLNDWLRKKQQYTDDETNLLKNVENMEQNILNRKNELVALIDKCAQSSLEQLSLIKQAGLKEIRNKIDENERQLVVTESFKTYCKQIEAKGSAVELCEAVPTLKRRAKEIQQTHRTHCQQPTESIQLCFEPSNLEELLKAEKAIGGIKVSKCENAVKESMSLSGKLDVPPTSLVFGVTKNKNKICVLCRKPNVIQIFNDEDSFDLQMEIDLKDIGVPYNIVSSENSNCLYVIGIKSNRIWKITPDDCRVTEWLTLVGERVSCLSLTAEDHALLITHGQEIQLKIYDSNSQLIRRFPFPRNLADPQHIIRKPNGEFIVIHTEEGNEGRWTISRLSSDGQTVVCRFIPKDKTQELNEPSHLALDSGNRRLFVADSCNNRVVLLDSDSLNFIKVLLTKNENGIGVPWRIFYDGKKKQLVVGQWPNKVDVYEVGH